MDPPTAIADGASRCYSFYRSTIERGSVFDSSYKLHKLAIRMEPPLNSVAQGFRTGPHRVLRIALPLAFPLPKARQ